MSVELSNEDFKIKVLSLGTLNSKDVGDGFCFVVKQGKAEISIEPDHVRKKVICKIHDDGQTGGYPETFELTITQFKNILRSNKTKKSLKSDEEKILEDAERAKQLRNDDEGAGSSEKANRKTRRKTDRNEEPDSRKKESRGKGRRVTRKRT